MSRFDYSRYKKLKDKHNDLSHKKMKRKYTLVNSEVEESKTMMRKIINTIKGHVIWTIFLTYLLVICITATVEVGLYNPTKPIVVKPQVTLLTPTESAPIQPTEPVPYVA